MERDDANCSDDKDRLTTLMIGQQRELFLYIYSLVHRFDDANDILQEVNLALWRDAEQSANVADFRSWTYRIAYNQVLTYRKRQGRLKLHFDESLLANLAEKARSQDELAEAYQAALRQCSRRLPAPNWQLLAMRYQESLSSHGHRPTAGTFRDRRVAIALSRPHRVVEVHSRNASKDRFAVRGASMNSIVSASDNLEHADELAGLIESLVEDKISADEHDRLANLLADDSDSQQRFLDHLRLHAALHWDAAELFGHDAQPNAVKPQRSPILGFLSTPSTARSGYFSSDWPVAYLIATVIFGIGLLVGSVVHVSQPGQIARQSSSPSRVVAEPRIDVVGRITGMVDCRWDKKSGVRGQGSETEDRQSLVSLGEKFVAGFRPDGNHL